MDLTLKDKGFLRLRSARGLAIEVVEGRVCGSPRTATRATASLPPAGATQCAATGWCWSAPKAMKRIFEFFRRAWARRRTQRELYSMSDRMLRDIGLNRDQIRSIRLF